MRTTTQLRLTADSNEMWSHFAKLIDSTPLTPSTLHKAGAHRTTAKELVVFQFETLKSFNHTYSWRVNDSLNFHSGYVTLEIKYVRCQDMKWRFGSTFRMQTTYIVSENCRNAFHMRQRRRKGREKKNGKIFYLVWLDDDAIATA